MYCFCVLLIFALVRSSNGDNESKIISTLQGPVRGYKSAEWNIYEFNGIPYATAPKGEDKFKAPLPPPTWTDTFDATAENIVCPQHEMSLKKYSRSADHNDSENCLVANVLVSNTDDISKPVLVYIHGGGYQTGSSYDLQPKTLVEEGNIIAVTFNYRLSVEGFLCLGTEKIPGNAGLKDMVALLRWVQKNIIWFGGNPNDVTIGGFSAGSSAVDLLMVSDATSDLFHKVIPESGVGNAVWSVQQDPLENAYKLAKLFNFNSTNIDDLEAFFTTASYKMLTTSSFLNERDSTLLFVPCLERDLGQEIILKDYPLNVLKKGCFRKLPTLIGVSSAEGYLRGDLFDLWKDEMDTNFDDFLPADVVFPKEYIRLRVAKQIKEFYFGGEPISAEGYLNYFGDVFFNYAVIKNVMEQAVAAEQNVYFYIYSFFDATSDLPNNVILNNSLAINAAYHCAQSDAVYDTPAPRGSGNFSNDYKNMKELMRKIWINFIKTGKPIPDGSALIPGGWPPAAADANPYMMLDKIPQLSFQLNTTRFMFWDEIYSKYYRKPMPPSTNSKYNRH